MIIKSKYNSTCSKCRQPVRIGDLVEWRWHGYSRAIHAACANTPLAFSKRVITARPIARARDLRGTYYCKGWNADDPHELREWCTKCDWSK